MKQAKRMLPSSIINWLKEKFKDMQLELLSATESTLADCFYTLSQLNHPLPAWESLSVHKKIKDQNPTDSWGPRIPRQAFRNLFQPEIPPQHPTAEEKLQRHQNRIIRQYRSKFSHMTARGRVYFALVCLNEVLRFLQHKPASIEEWVEDAIDFVSNEKTNTIAKLSELTIFGVDEQTGQKGESAYFTLETGKDFANQYPAVAAIMAIDHMFDYQLSPPDISIFEDFRILDGDYVGLPIRLDPKLLDCL